MGHVFSLWPSQHFGVGLVLREVATMVGPLRPPPRSRAHCSCNTNNAVFCAACPHGKGLLPMAHPFFVALAAGFTVLLYGLGAQGIHLEACQLRRMPSSHRTLYRSSE